jgi:AcrR family transcriptional regulator
MAETAAPGLRERNKIDKLQRIREAARAAFEEKGFDDATLREIARRAGVGLGTLFLYASDKRDLLFLLYTDALEAITARAFADVPEEGAFLDELVAIFDPYYRFFGEQPGLSRYLLRELTFFVHGEQGKRFQRNRHRVIDGIAARCAGAARSGRIRSAEDAAVIGRVLFAVYQAEIREWLLADAPDPAAGLAALRRSLRVAIEGVGPSA